MPGFFPLPCFECDNPARHKHHVVPKVLGGKRTLGLCRGCHGKVHGKEMALPALIRAGIQRARERGVRIGAAPVVTPAKHNKIHALRARGWLYREIAEFMGISKETARKWSLLST